MDYDEFSKMIIASKHINRLIFNKLTLIKSGTINFGHGINYRIRELSFQGTGHEDYSFWRSDKTEFDTIIQHIKQSHIHEELETLNVYGCYVDDVKLSGVLVVQEVWPSY